MSNDFILNLDKVYFLILITVVIVSLKNNVIVLMLYFFQTLFWKQQWRKFKSGLVPSTRLRLLVVIKNSQGIDKNVDFFVLVLTITLERWALKVLWNEKK